MPNLEGYEKIERTTLTIEETAKYLGVSYWLVGQMIRRNEIPHFRVGGRVLLRKKALMNIWNNKKKLHLISYMQIISSHSYLNEWGTFRY